MTTTKPTVHREIPTRQQMLASAEHAELIPVFQPLLEQEEIDAAVAALQMGWLGMGTYVGEFEEAIKQYTEATDRHVVAVSTGHAALHLALLLIGVKPDDEVITPSFNNIADFQAILATGAAPVFADVRDKDLCLDLNKAEKLISPKTKAIIFTDYGCMVGDHDRLRELSERHNVRVIHDAAHSFGSRLNGRMIGSFSDICIFSFDPVKNITTIDGGALVVQREEEAQVLREMRLIGMGQPTSVMYENRRAWTYDVQRLGFRYHMANLHAKIGLAQMEKMPYVTETRRQTCRRYSQAMTGIEGLLLPNTDFEEITPFLYYVRVPEERRDAFRDHLRRHGVDTGIHWQPGHWFSLFAQCRKGDLSTTEKIGRQIVSLPLHSKMSEESICRVCTAVRSFFQ